MADNKAAEKAPSVVASVETVEVTIKVPVSMSISGYFPKDATDAFREANTGMKHEIDMVKVASQPMALAYLWERGLAHLRDAATPAATGENKLLPLIQRHALGNSGITDRIGELERGIVPASGGRGSSVSSTLKYLRGLLTQQVSNAADRKLARAVKSVDEAKAWYIGVVARQYPDDTARAGQVSAHKWDMLMGMVQRRVEEDALLIAELPDVEMEQEETETE